MRRIRRGCFTTLVILAVIFMLSAAVLAYLDSIDFGYHRSVSPAEAALRDTVVDTAVGWLGCKESDSSHTPIVDIYNSHEPLARGYAVQYDDEWCSTYASAIAIQCGLTDIIPTECGCERHIWLFMEIDAWEESDDYIPLPGDYIFYSKEYGTPGDNTGWSDHVGIVVGVWKDWIKVIEGNKGNAVSYRYIKVSDWTIRGYGVPDYGSVN